MSLLNKTAPDWGWALSLPISRRAVNGRMPWTGSDDDVHGERRWFELEKTATRLREKVGLQVLGFPLK